MEKPYDNVNRELSLKGYPTGLFGTKWLMTTGEFKNLFNDCYQTGPNILTIERNVYERLAQVNYCFDNDLLMLIIISFTDQYNSLDDFSKEFYRVKIILL